MHKARVNLKAAFVITLTAFFTVICAYASEGQNSLSITDTQLADKVKGGLIGQLFGNLNGLEHEMEYIDEPGSVESYTPDLSDGAWTNDDTDIFSRDELPNLVKISDIVQRIRDIAERAIWDGGGRKVTENGQTIYIINCDF